MEANVLAEKIASFASWHYRFEFDGGVYTPTPDPSFANRHDQRRRYFFDALVALEGGSLAGKRVLDLGCNAGLFSLLALEAGADFVLGIDAREMYIEQANLVFEAKGIDSSRYRFEVANVFDWEPAESFEIALCLGLLDHVCRPVELFALMARARAETLVVDTEISRARSSAFEVSTLYDRHSVIDHALVLIPSRQAVLELAHEFGFAAVALAQNMTDYTGMADYRDQRRLAFVCSRSGPPQGLAAESRQGLTPWWVTAARNSRKGATARRRARVPR
jgi:2-polyprenyl-3-methyl-5-hydroxy-6-metoxy-1,4-benzoquinol methylase